LQDVTWPFLPQVMARQAARLGVNQRNQPFQRRFIALAPRLQQAGRFKNVGDKYVFHSRLNQSVKR